MRLEGIHGLMGGLDQQSHFCGSIRVPVFGFEPSGFHLAQAMAQGIQQSLSATSIIEQIVFEIRIALNHPNVA